MSRTTIFFIIISTLLIAGCEQNKSENKVQPEAKSGVLNLRNWNLNEINSTIELRGEWEFYWEEFLFQNDFNNETSTPKPQFFSLPGAWNDTLVKGEKLTGTGFGTYRLKVLINETFDEIAIKALSIQTSGRIFINGELISTAGIPGVNKETSEPGYKPQTILYEPDSDYLDIIIQVSNYDHRMGGLWGKITIGSERDMLHLWRYNRDRDFFIVGAVIFMAIYYLSLFLIHNQSKEAIYFSVFCFILALRIVTTGDIFILNLLPDLQWKALIFLEYMSFFIAIPAFLLFIYSLFRSYILLILTRVMTTISSIFSIITLFASVTISSRLIPVFQIFTVISGLYVCYILVSHAFKKDKLAIILLSGFLIMFMTAINDILYAANIINSTYFISYGILLFIIFQSIAMTMKFAKSFIEVERQQKQLLKTNMEYRHEIYERISLEEDLHISYQNNAKSKMAIIMGLAKLAEYRDSDTGTHIERIQELNSILARELQKHPDYIGYITDEYIEDLHISSILHDIGKVGIPDAILQKPGKLTSEEFEIMKQHSSIGGDSIKAVETKTGVRSFLTLAKEIAYMHHERWDGTGYPRGIREKEIPLSARLTALVDVYDALTTKRCYKEAFSHKKAKHIILESKGTHFDPVIVEAFLAIEDKFEEVKKTLHDELTFEVE